MVLNSSVRLAVLSFALSSWIEGSAQLRSYLITPPIPPELDDLETRNQTRPRAWDRFLLWLKRRGRPMDDLEKTALGFMDVATAYILLHSLRTGPLLPFLLTPLLTTLPLPKSLPSRPLRWSHIFVANLCLALFHEAERVAIAVAIRAWRKGRDSKYHTFLGPVIVTGDALTTPDEVDCMICSGGSDDAMAQSISSLSSLPADMPSSLGPLEAFCTTAPQKHVAHRDCFLRWHAAYRQQRVNLIPEAIIIKKSVQTSDPSKVTEGDRRMAVAILQAAGFNFLIPSLHIPSDFAMLAPRVLSSRLDSAQELVLYITPAMESATLASLKTMAPPCPGCRSAVNLRFTTIPTYLPSHSTIHPPSPAQPAMMRKASNLVDAWKNEWSRLVSGRTLAIRLVTQYTFLLALVSMIQARRRAARA